MLLFFTLTTLVVLTECNVKKGCPSKEIITSCSCLRFSGGNILNCGNTANAWDLVQDLHAVRDYSIVQVNLWQVDFQYLPAGFVKYLPIESLTIRESVILALESDDGKVMFEGADESLEVIFILAVAGVTSWRWKPLEALKNLKSLEVSTCEIRGITSEFGRFSQSLEKISLLNNEISFVDNEAFSKYTNLKVLDLANNKITNIKRAMFPDPAKHLEVVKLSANKIEVLPSDIFTNMPQLKELHLRLNRIKWLPEDSLAPVKGQLDLLTLHDNDIHCCPSIEWAISSEFKKRIRGECRFPPILSGRALSSLEIQDLAHGMC